ncbi:MAG: hypothetical protein V4437_01795 [Patescibacteria group bacterium]
MSERRTLPRAREKRTGLNNPENRKTWWTAIGVFQNLLSGVGTYGPENEPVAIVRKRMAKLIRHERHMAHKFGSSKEPMWHTTFSGDWYDKERAEWVKTEHRKRLRALR